MEQQPLFFSFLFFVAFAAYFFFGIFLLFQNAKAKRNRAFFAVCVSLCLWSLGFAVANAAPTLEVCLFWRRISAVGWTTAYALLLNFFLLLSDTKWPGRDTWVYRALLYIPAGINLYVFSLSDSLTKQQYNFVRRPSGWVNVAPNNFWDFFFYVYFATYLLAALLVLRRWRKQAVNERIGRQARLMYYSLLASGLLGALTDLVLRFVLTNPLPQMGPLVTLIPMGTAWFLIKRHRMLGKGQADDSDGILDEVSESRLYHYVSLTFVASGLLGLLPYFVPVTAHAGIKSASIQAGLAALVLGSIIFLLSLLRPTRLKVVLIFAVTLLSLSLVAVYFADFGGLSVWVFPLLFMIVSLVFDTSVPLIAVMIGAVATQGFFWSRMPEQIPNVGHFDYVFRTGFLLIAFWLGLFVNRVYRRRLKENIYQRDFQKMVSNLSMDFMLLNPENMEEKIKGLLRSVGEFFGMNSSYLILFEPGTEKIQRVYTWHRRGLDYLGRPYAGSSMEEMPWLARRLRSKELVYVPDLEGMPPEASTEIAPLTCPAAQESAILPIHSGERLLGFIGFNCMDLMGGWTESQFALLRVLGNLVAESIVKLEAEREIEFLAYYDELTGLPNRTLFTERLNNALQAAEESGRHVAVMFLDLDGFKTVNDVLGHSAGDLLLQEVALNLVDNVGTTDCVSRFGADEFLIMLNDMTGQEDICLAADKLISMFSEPFILNEQEFFVTASAGIAISPQDGADSESLITNADIALYEAKRQGKNRYIFCTPELKEEVRLSMELSNSLFRAVERNEFELYYQPQVNLQTNEITGLEALLRWNHPELGMVSPGVFIPLAEKNGLITRIGEWVLETALLQSQKWQEAGLPPVRMSVNLSAAQFNDPRIVEKIGEALAKSGVNPRHLELEITENMAVWDIDYTVDTLQKLRDLGVTIAIDDFGTEYSALGRLKVLPLDRIKIDMQFIQGIDESEKDRAITEVMIYLAKSLDLEVLAEGVETETQVDFLREKLCDDVQGFFYHRPKRAAEIEALLRRKFLPEQVEWTGQI